PLHPALAAEVGRTHVVPRDLVERGVELSGKVCGTASEVLIVRGSICGDIQSDGGVIIAEGGQVKGSIHAAYVQISGHVARSDASSTVVSRGVLALGGEAVLDCDAKAASLFVAFGARLNGYVHHGDATVPESMALAAA
ncbi:unnamed protein product, partial [Phaeothamnion confervicola]